MTTGLLAYSQLTDNPSRRLNNSQTILFANKPPRWQANSPT